MSCASSPATALFLKFCTTAVGSRVNEDPMEGRAVLSVDEQLKVITSGTMQVVPMDELKKKLEKGMTILPKNPMDSNTLGKVINIRLGPEDIPSVPRKTKTAGIIIIPARKAIAVSKISI